MVKPLFAAVTRGARPHAWSLVWFRAWFLALLMSGVLGGAAVAPLAQAASVSSKEIGTKLLDAQKALKEHKYADAVAKVKEAEGVAKKTPADQHIINQLGAAAYTGAKQYPEAIKYYEAWLNDGQSNEAEQQKIVKGLVTLYYQTQNYDKTLEYGQKAIKGGYADDNVQTAVVQSYYQKKDFKAVQRMEEEALAAQTRSGGRPKQHNLEMLLDSCSKQGDKECTTRTFERLVSYYPAANYWENLLYDLSKSNMKEPVRLQLFRLMLEVNVLKKGEDYSEMAQLAEDAGAYGESVDILNKAFAASAFPDQHLQQENKRLLERVKHENADLSAQLPARMKAAEAAPTGVELVKIGCGYMGLKQYPQAIDALNKALAKGGLDNGGADARLTLGVVQFRAGNRDEAVKDFHQVKGEPTLERIASLWALRVKQPEAVAKR